MLELLSPAGSLDALHAAVCNGADAVYLGVDAFNARHGARNFTLDELPDVVRYCHVRGVAVHLTLNTLVTDREMPDAAEYIAAAARAGVDAFIVQDLGMVSLCHQIAPKVALHASTQMSLHSLEGVREAAELGLSRAVLARELPRDAIAFICRNSPIEIEVFVHGALCMCYSGQCELSAVIGRRSGNRGLCAQPCRLPYGGKNSYPMSLKDLCLLPRLRALCDAGVSSLKIEGRMKRPEYVAIVTRIYAAVLRENRAPTREEMQTLAKVFSRDGFTQGYLDDNIGPSMFGVRSETPDKELKPLYQEAAHSYAEGQEADLVPIQLSFTAKTQQDMQLTVTDGVHTASVTADAAEAAQHKETTAADIEKSLKKTGGTMFAVREMDVQLDSGLRIPARAVNDMRRQALEQLTQQRASLPLLRENKRQTLQTESRGDFRGYTVQVRQLKQLTDAMAQLPVETFYVPVQEMAQNEARVRELLARGCSVVPVLPRIIWDREQKQVVHQLEQCKRMGCTAALCGNIAQPKLVQACVMAAFGDFGLNAWNGEAMETLRQIGVARQTLSYELRLPQIRDMHKPMQTELIVCGRLPLMITENCMIAGKKGGCRRDGRGACAKGVCYLTDRMGAKFPVFREEHCRNTLYNSQPLYLEPEEYRQTGVTYARLLFSDESPRQATEIARRVIDGQTPDFGAPMTRGLYRRGVE